MGGDKEGRPTNPTTGQLITCMLKLEELVEELTSGDENRAETAARSFPAYGDEGLTALAAVYAVSDVDIRWWAIRSIAEFDPQTHPESSNYLIKGLYDPDAGVKACAAVGLREKPAPKAVSHLIKLLSHPDKLVVRTAGDALAAHGKAASPALIGLIDELIDDHNIVKVEAVRALALIGDPGSISSLYRIWENGSSMVQHWAEKGLNDMGIGMAFFNPAG